MAEFFESWKFEGLRAGFEVTKFCTLRPLVHEKLDTLGFLEIRSSKVRTARV